MNRASHLAIVLILLIFHPLVAQQRLDSAKKTVDFEVSAPPENLELDPFYKKYVNASGYPIVASEKVNDYALKEAAYWVDQLLSKRPDIREAMIKHGSRLVVMAYSEFTTDIPEHSRLKPKEYWDARARGLGGSTRDPVCSCAEENVLAYPGDPYSQESILIHEFAHNIHLCGLIKIDKTFDPRLKSTYQQAMKNDLWKGKYASTNHMEYWAEGVQSWFNDNRENDHDHNHVNTREELKQYDPGLAKLCEEVFGNTEIEYTKPQSRLNGHLSGYDPSKAPRFRWPLRLQKSMRDIRQKAAERGKENDKDK